MAATQTHTSNYIVNNLARVVREQHDPSLHLRVSSAAQVPPYCDFFQVGNSCGPQTCTAPDCAGTGGGYGMSAGHLLSHRRGFRRYDDDDLQERFGRRNARRLRSRALGQ